MISPRQNPCTIVLALALLGSVGRAGEPNEIPIHLEFEVSPTPLGPYSPSAMGSSVLQPLVNCRPAYAAAIVLVPPVEWLPSPLRRTMSNFLGERDGRGQREGYAEQHGGLSEQQKAFLQVAKSVFNYPTSNFVQNRPDPTGPERVLLFAMTLDDAKKMAQAYYAYARNDWWQGYVNRLNTEIRDLTQTVTQEETKAAEIDRVLAATRKSQEDLGKIVPYRTESEAHEAIGELDRMLNAAQVEIAGIKAKMQAVMKHQRESEARRRSQDVIEKLDMMYIEEAVVLQGAEARQKMATSLRERASRYIDLKSTLSKATGERELLVVNLEADQKVLADRRRELEATLQQEPKIPDKVIIYPVKWIDNAPTN